jgi:methionine-rich copper-binding protein CopC
VIPVVRRTNRRRSVRRPARPIVLVGLLALLASLLTNGVIAAAPAAAATCPCSIWSSTATPGTPSVADSAVELGVKFRSDVAGQITGIRFYKGSGNTGTHVGHLWTTAGANLGTVTFQSETASGWQQALFPTPISITAGTTYVASYYAPNGGYAADNGFFASKGVDNAPLHALQDGVDGANGVYRYGTGGGFPGNTYQSSNYWVDVVFATGAADTTAPTVTSQSPASGATNVPTTTTVSATFSEAVQASTVTMGLTGPGGTAVSGTTAYNSSTQTATFTPGAALTASTAYTASVSGAKDLSGNVMSPASWSFTTSSSTSGCPCSIWPSTTTPGTVDSNDASAVELGVKFRSSTAGYISGIRFYKAAANTGTHTGSLWSTAGTRLSTVTFSGESGSGWQTMTLPAPVAINANTTYIASYHTDAGHYSLTNNGFASAVTRGPLTALASAGNGGNGVYLYGGGGFPKNTFQASNYWVDVVFDTTAPPDTIAPTLTARTPAANASGVPTSTTVTATFSEPVQAGTAQIALSGPGGAVAGALSYNGGTNTATFTPSGALANSTSYTATVSGAKDNAGNTMAPVTWSFTTAAPAPDAPDQGPGGPALVIKSSTTGASTFTSFTAEILRAEGLNEFAVADLSSVTATTLSQYDVVILGATPLTATQVSMFTTWVQGGGNLIAFKPDKQLAGLLGLTPVTTAPTTLADGYVKVDTTAAPGAGITDQTIQFHGTADRYTVSGARAVAALYSNGTTATTNPALSLVSVGTNGGQAAAFAYDFPQSIVYTRQGNPAWAGTERDGTAPIRSDDLYFGGSPTTDWVNLDKAAIPQADEQQRLLANLIGTMNLNRKPLPRFWYFPRSAKAVIVATGDDHGTGDTAGRFNQYAANSAAGCVVDQWQCLRFSAYVWPSTALTNSQAAGYTAQGFEVGDHPQNNCSDYNSAAELDSTYSSELSTWKAKYTSLTSQVTNRFHCMVESDWSSQPTTELKYGIRFDVNYYYWPGNKWIKDRPGFMTGSGMPMRFTTINGTMIDVYQAATQMTDESDQTYPFTVNTMLDNALGPLGYYGAFVANMHTDNVDTFDSDQLLASAKAHGVPMVSSRQMLTWLDGRNGSSFSGITWSNNQLSFTVKAGSGANGLTAMVPTVASGGLTLTGLSQGGTAVPFTRTTIKGVEYAMFQAQAAAYSASYGSAGPAAVQSTSAVATSSTAVTLTADTAPADTTVTSYGTSADKLDQKSVNAEQGSKHRHELKGLQPSTTYYYQVTATSPAGATSTSPVASFKTPANPKTAPNVSGYSYYALPDGTAAVSWTTDRITDATVFLGTSPASLTAHQSSVSGNAHIIVATGLKPGTTYYARVQSTDADGNTKLWPAASAAPVSFVTSAAGVADHTAPSFRTGTAGAGVVVTDDGLGGVTLAAGASQGQFTSRVLDSAQMVTWDRLTYFADQPTGSKIQVSVRAGSTPTPDGTWTAWTAVGQGGRVDASSRYVQYSVDLTAGSRGAPVLNAVGITHNGQLPTPVGER